MSEEELVGTPDRDVDRELAEALDALAVAQEELAIVEQALEAAHGVTAAALAREAETRRLLSEVERELATVKASKLLPVSVLARRVTDRLRRL